MKILKKNFLLITSFLILLVILLINTNSYINYQKDIEQKNLESLKFCQSFEYQTTEYEAYCNNAINTAHLKLDFYTMFSEITISGFRYIGIIIFLFVITPALYNICKYLKHKRITYDSTRESYKTSIKKLFKESYKSAFILPIIIALAMIFSLMFTKNIDPSFSIYYGSEIWEETTINNFFIFISLYMLNIIIHSILYVNIALCIARKKHNFFIALILTFLSIIAIETILEVLLNGIIFTIILKSDIGIIFNIINSLTFNDTVGIGTCMIIPLILMIISFIVLYIIYNNKEKLIIDCENNA